MVIFFLWMVVVCIQEILSFGTAYRLTKNGGDNGVALWGWFFALGFASLIPGLGFYLWHKYRDPYGEGPYKSTYTQSTYAMNTNSNTGSGFSSGNRGSKVYPGMPIPREEPADANPAESSDAEQKKDFATRKQCSRCHTLYNAKLDNCPQCGKQ